MDQEDVAFPGEFDDLGHEVEVHARRGRIVGKRKYDHAGLRPGVVPTVPQRSDEVTVGRERHLTDVCTGEQRRIAVDGVRRRRHERRVAGLEHHPHEVGEAFLGADGLDDLRLGVEGHPEPPVVEVGGGLPQLRNAAAGRIPVVSRVADGLGQLVDRNVWRGQVGVAEAQIDDVPAGPSCLDLQGVDDREDVGREFVDAPVLQGSQRTRRSGGGCRSCSD